MAKITVISDVKVDYKQVQKILKIVGDTKKELDNKDYYVSIKEEVEQIDKPGRWNWAEIVERYNLNYGRAYDKRKLQDAFRDTITELDRIYKKEYGDEKQGCLRWFKKEDSEEYWFWKKTEILWKKNGPAPKELLDEELDELCEVFELALQFTVKKRQTVSGLIKFGILLGKNDDRIVEFGPGGGITLDRMLQEEIRCYITVEMPLSEIRARIKEIFKRISILKGDKEIVECFLEKSLNHILRCYRREVFEEMENIKIASKCSIILENAPIRTYTPRGQKVPGTKRDDQVVILFNDEKNYFNVPRNFIQEAYDMALSLKGTNDSDNLLKWEERLNDIIDRFYPRKDEEKIFNHVELTYLRQILMEELITWMEKADLLITSISRVRLLEKIRYYRKMRPESQQIEIKKKTGELSIPIEEKKFWEEGEKGPIETILKEQVKRINKQYNVNKSKI